VATPVLQRLREVRGITIIETTVMLSVLFILAGAMSPIVSESVTTARAVRAKNDASMIAMGLINLQKDLGGDALAFSSVTIAEAVRLPELLATAGQVPEIDDRDEQESGLAAFLAAPRRGTVAAGGERGARRLQRLKWREAAAEALDDHLMTNRRGYRYRRPGEYGGWNGPYISAPIKGDPWGNQYMVNSGFLDGGSTAADEDGRPRRAVFVISPGANGIVETPFEQPINEAQAFGDDIVVRIQ
jgi:type II secretory pathway pseudopilin PulG